MSKAFSFGPIALTNTPTTNLLNPAAAGSGTGYTPTATRITLRRLRAVNKTGAGVAVSLWLGATGANAAGTEFEWSGAVVPANSFLEVFLNKPIEASQFLVGGAGAATSLSLEGDGVLDLA